MIRIPFAWAALAAACLPGLAAAQVLAPAPARDGVVGVEAIAGSRDAGAFGREGEELRLSWRGAAATGWSLAAGVGVARDEAAGATRTGYGAELRRALGPSGFSGGLGARVDYDRTLIPGASLAWTQPDAAYPFAAALVAEFPQGGDRDSADLLVTAGQALPCVATLACALEFAGEDLEGFFSDDEAEGGARLVLGPSLGWRAGASRTLTLFAGWIHAATINAPRRAGYADNRDGAMVRLGLRFGS